MKIEWAQVWEWFKSTPLWKKIAIPALIGSLLVILASCGTARVVANVNNNADGTQTTVTISGTQGGDVSVQATPDVSVQLSLPKKSETKRGESRQADTVTSISLMRPLENKGAPSGALPLSNGLEEAF